MGACKVCEQLPPRLPSLTRPNSFHRIEIMPSAVRWLAASVLTICCVPASALALPTASQDKPKNVALNRPVTSKSEQKPNFRRHLTDGRLGTRFCPDGPQTDEWVTVDLKRAKSIAYIRLHWEKLEGVAYRYIVEASADNKTWTTIVDFSDNIQPGGVHEHAVAAQDVRYLRTTFLGSSTGAWGSIRELEASPGELPDVSTLAAVDAPVLPTLNDVKVPDGFRATLFGVPPSVNYPVCLTAAATGEVFVGVDDQGSLGKEPGRGKVLRCIDTDGDGRADQINEFARMDHPRGLVYDNGSLWVLHPPFLTVFHDTDGDGTADESERLIEGISTEEVAKRGADHTTNGIRQGIDGWIYIAVGDFGFQKAVAVKDGTVLSRRGGGVVRIRPNGTEMEVYSWGQRNILDVAIDPQMNLFTRDNTNDGGGWDIRLSHVMQTANYGYPSLYKNFSTEIMPPLADYGGGSGCGSMYFQDDRWPEPFNDLLLTCDWGRSEVFSHDLPANGPTFDAQQGTFVRIPRPTDIDVDAAGRMYVSSWKDGRFSYQGEYIGFVAQIVPEGFTPQPVPAVASLKISDLVQQLRSPSAAMRHHVQREILRRFGDRLKSDAADRTTDEQQIATLLAVMAADASEKLSSRVIAVYTLKQLLGASSHSLLADLMSDDQLVEHCLRAMADRRSEPGADTQLFVNALSHQNPRVQAAALIGLGRLTGAAGESVAASILPMTVFAESTTEGDDWRNPHPERVIAHLAVQTLVRLQAVDACLAALTSPYRDGALWALRSMHSQKAVDGLFKVLSTQRDPQLRQEVWATLIRLYHKEGAFVSGSPKWWGTRPDTTGPYYDRATWAQSDRIAAAVKVALGEGDKSLNEFLTAELSRHVVRLEGLSQTELMASQEPQQAIQLPAVDPNNPAQIANMAWDDVLKQTLDCEGTAAAGEKLFRTQSCVNCHTFANGQQPKGPHLVDIGKRYSKKELIESIVQPSKKIAQGFDTWVFVMASGKTHTGFVVLESAETVTIRQTDGLGRELLQDDIDDRLKQEISMMPKGVVGNLTTQQLADLIAWLQTLK